MKVYDISQEVFSCAVFPGDPSPERIEMMKINEGAICNLTAFKMCAHNGTHVDAPYHFIDKGKTIDEVDMKRFVGYAYVASHEGDITAEDATSILEKARRAAEEKQNSLKADQESCDAYNRILIKGKAVMTEDAAKIFAENKILLFGNEFQTVGPEDAPMAVHLIMLGEEIVLLEGIRLGEVEDGVYFLSAAPINLGNSDGAPCRAILVEF
ncbi:Kynurenine formamidase [Lachnospiraceae bacterium]|nr:Kynurenine formamidase [Lachnospiraceae bacterium]